MVLPGRTALREVTAIKPRVSQNVVLRVTLLKYLKTKILKQFFSTADQEPKQKNCENSWYGCCPDGKTSAQGPEFEGCPFLCGCNKLGSYTDTCDVETQQCKCKPGVGGLKCDRCKPGYWGLPKISSGHQGCIRK